MMHRRILPLLLVAAACAAPGPRPVALGAELCQHCHMTVADERFVSQLVSTTGKVLVYDDPGCLATAVQEGRVEPARVHSLWVTDFLTPGTLVQAEEAWFVRADGISSPMASGLLAVATERQADSVAAELGGVVLRWDAVRRDTGHGH